jgi:hypothetical protein
MNFWNHKQTGTAFFGTMLSFGALIIAVVSLFVMPIDAGDTQTLIQSLAMIIMAGLLIEGIGPQCRFQSLFIIVYQTITYSFLGFVINGYALGLRLITRG